jgi:hypothetical protein
MCSVPLNAIVVGGGNPNAAPFVYTGQNDLFQGSFNLSGVALVGSNNGGCSGALLSDGISILTAGHCVSPGFGQPNYGNVSVVLLGPLNTGPGTGDMESMAVSQTFVDPGWNGNAILGFDLAVLRLTNAAPSWATRYSLYTGLPTASPLIIAGFGVSGTGATGADGTTYPQNGTLRAGTNTYVTDGSNSQFGFSSSMLLGQFYDASHPSTNAIPYLGAQVLTSTPYTSSNLVDLAPGDSGGPSFFNGQIIGVHEIVACVADPINVNNCRQPPSTQAGVGSVFGEFFGDTSVAANASWIAAQEASQVPEPASMGLLLIGAAMMGAARARRARSRAR